MTRLRIIDALAGGHHDAAHAIVFEYVALTQGEAGLPVPQHFAELPEQLQDIVAGLAERYAQPGATLLLALMGEDVCGCVAAVASDRTVPSDLLVQRLYVQADYRRAGVARALMAHIHRHAVEHGFDRLVLNVLPGRVGALAFYRALGYQPLTDEVRWPTRPCGCAIARSSSSRDRCDPSGLGRVASD